MILNYLKKSVKNILLQVKTNLTRSSKPTQAQGLCGLTHCYTDARTGALNMRNKNGIKVKKYNPRYN